eukprot:786870-Rhodomonas_salina.1
MPASHKLLAQTLSAHLIFLAATLLETPLQQKESVCELRCNREHHVDVRGVDAAAWTVKSESVLEWTRKK